MSLLTICNNAVSDTSFSQVSQIFGNPDQTAIAMLGCARRSVKDLIRHANGGWTALIEEYIFAVNAVTVTGATVTQGSPIITNISSTAALTAGIFTYTGNLFPNNAVIQSVDSASQVTMSLNASTGGTGQTIIFGQSGYALPSDFLHFVDGTMWDRSRYREMRGPMSPQQWQAYKSSIMGRASIQRRWRLKQPPGGTQGTTYFFIDPAPADSGSQLVFEYITNSPILTGTSPHQDWTTDGDVCKLSEYIIELGVKWRMLRRFGYDYSVEMDEYERAVDVYMANDGGMPTLSLAGGDDMTLLGPFNVPETGFGV